MKIKKGPPPARWRKSEGKAFNIAKTLNQLRLGEYVELAEGENVSSYFIIAPALSAVTGKRFTVRQATSPRVVERVE